MSVKLASVKANTVLENDGDWIESATMPDVAYKVRSVHYGPFKIALGLVNQKLRRRYKDNPIPPEVLFVENGKLYHEYLLLDWRGFDEPYSKDRALEVLTTEGFRKIHEEIRDVIGEVGQNDIEFIEGALKN